MSDLIRRIDALTAGGTCGALGGHEIPIRAILNIPAVDAVPVVRCKDCGYFGVELFCNKRLDAYGKPLLVSEDDFCSHAERMAKS